MSSEKPKRNYKRLVILFWLIFFSILAVPSALFYSIAKYEALGKLPTFEELENPKSFLATEIYSYDKKLLGTIFSENRSVTQYDELSPYLIDGLVSTEDERFYEHTGIDPKSLARAAAKMGKAGGGSTVTQQLAKMLFTNRVKKNKLERLFQKFNEWVIAVELERQYTKDEIITMYFNKLDFVNNAAGIKSASKVYFSSTPSDLKIEQAAMLVGMAKNPALFNPLRRPDTVRFRRNVVLGQMLRNNKITQLEFDSISELDLGLKVNRASHKEGLATYFREEVRANLKKILKGLKKSNGKPYNIYRDGLTVHTTLDSKMQEYAEKAMVQHLGGELQPDFFAHWKKKTPGLKKYAPFYFEDMTAKQKSEIKENLIKRGIRNSGRYKKALKANEDLYKKSRKYKSLRWKYTVLESDLKIQEDLRTKYQSQINTYSRDSIASKSREAIIEKGKLNKLLTEVKQKKKEIKEKMAAMKPDYDEAKEDYLEDWEPFDKEMMTHFSKPVEMEIFKWKRKKNPKGSKIKYSVKGVSVDTTMSPRDSVIYHKWFLRSGLMSIDPHTGYIKAWVGGFNYKHFQYDHVRGRRQVGSTFKPFVYGTLIENGGHPCDKILNDDVTIPKGMYGLEQDWSPKNAAKSRLDGELLTLKMALANSINSITANIMKRNGPSSAVDLARRCGITSYIEPVPSICLGTCDLSLFEMVKAYSTFANKGMRVEPTFIYKITDKNGKIIYSARPASEQAMSEVNAYKMLQLLGGVASYGPKVKGKATYGTGVRLRSSARPYGGFPYSIKIAGKTGTTQMQSDGWFMGITPDLVTGVWTGCEDRAAHFLSLNMGMGTNMALPIWGYYMKAVYTDKNLKISKGDFEAPKGMDPKDFDCIKVNANREDYSEEEQY